MNAALLYWVERETSPGRWQREAAYAWKQGAEKAARWFRREYRKRARVVAVANA